MSRTEALGRLSRLVGSSPNLESALDEITAASAELTDAVAAVWMADEREGILEISRFSDPALARDFPLRTVRFGEGLAGRVAAERVPVRVADVVRDGRGLAPSWWRAHGLTSFIGVPIVAEGQLLAVLALLGRRPLHPAPETLELLEVLAGSAAMVIKSARLRDVAERQRREAELLAQLAASINASLDVDTVLRRVVDGARELCRADAAKIALWDSATDTMVFRHWQGNKYPGYATLRLERGKGLGGNVWATGQAIRITSYPNDPRFTKDYLEVNRADEHEAEIVVPITIEGRVEGLLYVSRRSADPFVDRDTAVALRLAGQAAVALRNAQLFAGERQARARAEESERALAERETLLQTIIETEPECVKLLALDGTLLRINRAGLEMLEVGSAEEIIGTSLLRFVAPKHRDAFMGLHARVCRGEAGTLEFESVGGRGTIRFLETHAVPRRDREARIIAALGITRDVTERRRAEDALRVSEEQLRLLQKMDALGRLAGGIAHDFNNLLTVIEGRSQILLARSGDAAIRRDVELIHRTAERAAGLTRQLLAFSRKQVLQPRVLDLNAVVAGVASMFRRLIPEDIDVVIRPGADLGRVKVDSSQIEQVITNLVLNARDAMPEGGWLTIETSSVELDERFARAHPGMQPGPHVVLAVRDTGVGIEEDLQPKIFEPFFTTKEGGRGTGLGLATVYGIVKQHNGCVTVESAPGRGATFRVHLPRVPEIAEREPARPVSIVLGPGAGTVLLVEDDTDVRDVAADALRIAGYTVLAAGSPSDAIDLSKQHEGPIDLLVSDVVMPQMSGGELAAKLTAIRPSLRVLFVSGYTDDAIVQHGVLDPGAALLPKPFGADALVTRVGEILGAR